MKQIKIKQIARQISLLGMLINVHVYCNCQIVDSDSSLLEIRGKITYFFIEQGLLKKSTIDDTSNYVFAYEILEEKIIGFNKNGVYRIGVLQSHSNQHILIKEGDKVKLYNLKEIDLLIKALLEYRIRNNIDDGRIIKYFSSIIDIYWYQFKKRVDWRMESQ